MRIQKISLKNFRSFRELTLELHDLNVLIGTNGSGKSNLLSLFTLLKHAADGRLQDYIDQEIGKFSDLLHFNSDDGSLTIEIHFENLTTLALKPVAEGYVSGSAILTLELVRLPKFGYIIRKEELTHPPYPGYTRPYQLVSVTHGRVHRLSDVTARNPPESDSPVQDFDAQVETELALATFRDRIRYPTLDEIREELANFQIIKGFGGDVLRNMGRAQELRIPRQMRLDEKATNLVSVLYQLANKREYSTQNRQLQEALGAVFEGYQRLDVPLTEGSSAVLEFQEQQLNKPIPAHLMSDGQLRFIGLAVTLLQPNPPSLIALDEPEIGLHPKMMEVLVELMRLAAQKTQIIVTTHSPVLLSKLEPENILITSREAGDTQIRRLNLEKLEKWLDRYTLGQLWQSGRLER